MITIMGAYVHYSEQFSGKVIEKIKNQKNEKLINGFKYKKLWLQ